MRITEDYVSFETAKLLKEKGFDEECYGYYDTTKHPDYILEHSGSEMDSNDGPDCYISAPTLQMTMKWLREVHGIFIGVSLCKRYENTMDDDTKIMFFFELLNLKEKYPIDVYSQEYVHTYEEAVEAAIKYCLTNLI